MALVDEIKKRLTQPAEAAPAVSQQAQAIAAFQAKTGKATGGGAPRASNVGEQMALGQVDAANRQLTAKGATAAAGLGAGQAQQAAAAGVAQARLVADRTDTRAGFAAARTESVAARGAQAAEAGARLRAQEAATVASVNAKASATIASLTSDRGIAEADIFAEYTISNNELAYRRDYLQLEQRAHVLALRDREYVDNLVRIGNERRLESDFEFAAEMQEMVMGANLEERLAGLGFKLDMNADANAFAEQLDSMSLDQAMAIAMAGNRDASMSTMLNNVGTVSQGLADNYRRGKSEPATQPTSEEA